MRFIPVTSPTKYFLAQGYTLPLIFGFEYRTNMDTDIKHAQPKE